MKGGRYMGCILAIPHPNLSIHQWHALRPGGRGWRSAEWRPEAEDRHRQGHHQEPKGVGGVNDPKVWGMYLQMGYDPFPFPLE